MIWRRLLHDAFKLAAAGLDLLIRSAPVKSAAAQSFRTRFLSRPDGSAEAQSRKDIAPARATCRNFFNLHQRWRFAVLRLADAA